MLHELCKGIGEPSQTNGRPHLPLEGIFFNCAFKVYSTVSQRRFISDLRDALSKGYISKLPCYNSIFNYFEDENLTLQKIEAHWFAAPYLYQFGAVVNLNPDHTYSMIVRANPEHPGNKE